jgi:predicted transcriptional regulator
MESISKQLREMAEEKDLFRSSNLFRCILGLNELESHVFSYLLKNDYVTTLELANVFDKDRSSIQRALQNLSEMKVILRDSMSLKEYNDIKGLDDSGNRGYVYVYSARDLEYIKFQFQELLDKWYDSMKKYIKSLDSLFDCYEEEGKIC